MLTTSEVLLSIAVGLFALLLGLKLSNFIGVAHCFSKSMIVCFFGYLPIGIMAEYFLGLRVFLLWGGAREGDITIEGLLAMIVSMFLFGLFLPVIGDLVYQKYQSNNSANGREG